MHTPTTTAVIVGVGAAALYVFVRKYKAGTQRTKIRGHLDQSIFTFNLALSDQDEVEGGQLFVCKKAPEGYNWLFHGAEGLIHNPIDAMLTFRDLVLDKAFGALKWFDFHHNPKRIRANMDGKDLCKVAQPDAGEAVFHHGNRNHGVLPTAAGTRHSMIFFIKRCYVGGQAGWNRVPNGAGAHVPVLED